MANPDIQKQRDTTELREALRSQMLDHMAFRESPQDTIAYTYAASALKRFAERGLGAAKAVAKELERQRQLPQNDPQRMSPDELQKWERMLTEVETWTLTIPNLLQQARTVQYNPDMREMFFAIFNAVHERDQALNTMDMLRFRALKGSTKNPFSPFERAVPPEFYELATIATTQWFIREHVRIHPDLFRSGKEGDLKLFQESLQILRDAEMEGEWSVEKAQPLDQFVRAKFGTAFFRDTVATQQQRDEQLKKMFEQGRIRVNGKEERTTPSRMLAAGDSVSVITVFASSTLRVGDRMDATRRETDQQRNALNAERVTQNLPAAVDFAYQAKSETDVWRQLLTDIGNEKDHARYAKQLREDVARFRQDFMEKKAFEEFKKEAREQLDSMKDKNDRMKKLVQIFTWFTGTGDAIPNRLTTTPEEFDRVYDEVMAKVEESFNAVATSENAKSIADLEAVLARVEAGEKVEQSRIADLLTAYGKILLNSGRIMGATQAWQTSENIQRVGGRGPTNNLDLVTRVDNKSLDQWLAGFGPYNSLKTLTYKDKQGRIIIVDVGPSVTERTWSHVTELGKLGAQHAALQIILTQLISRVHYLFILAPGIHGAVKFLGDKVAGPATAIIQGELAMYEAKRAAQHERMKISAHAIEEIVKALVQLQEQKAPNAVKAVAAEKLAEKLYHNIASLLHTAEEASDLSQLATGHRDSDVRQDLMMEANLYANQLLMATGFPPLVRRDNKGPGSLPSSVDELVASEKKNGYDITVTPELRGYIEAKAADDTLVANAEEWAQYRKILDSLRAETHVRLDDLRGRVEPPKPKKSQYQQILDGEDYPRLSTQDAQARELWKIAQSSEMQPEYTKLSSSVEKKEELLKYAADIMLFSLEINREREKHFVWEVQGDYNAFERWLYPKIPGTITHRRADTVGDQRHLIDRAILDDWNTRARKLIRETSMPKVLAAALYLEKEKPTQQDIAAVLDESSDASNFSAVNGKSSIAKFYLDQWAYIRMYADKYAPPEKTISNEPYLLFDEKTRNYRGEYKEKDFSESFTFESLSNANVFGTGKYTYPSKEKGFKIVFPDADTADWAGFREWSVWGAGIFTSDKFPETFRKRMKEIMTMPYEGDRDWASVDRVMCLFPQEAAGRGKLHDALDVMYKESFQKHFFLKELVNAVNMHGGYIGSDNWEKIYHTMREAQEYGLFRYIPLYEKR